MTGFAEVSNRTDWGLWVSGRRNMHNPPVNRRRCILPRCLTPTNSPVTQGLNRRNDPAGAQSGRGGDLAICP